MYVLVGVKFVVYQVLLISKQFQWIWWTFYEINIECIEFCWWNFIWSTAATNSVKKKKSKRENQVQHGAEAKWIEVEE